MREHVLINSGKFANRLGWYFFLSVWTEGAYIPLDEAASYGQAKRAAQEIALEWGISDIRDEVSS